MLICPDCAATNVEVSANVRGIGERRWHGCCIDCGFAWEFDDV